MARRINAQALDCQELDFLGYLFTADSVRLSLFVFTHCCFRKPQQTGGRHTGLETEFNVKWLFNVSQCHLFWGQ